jgi:hypothetical protein
MSDWNPEQESGVFNDGALQPSIPIEDRMVYGRSYWNSFQTPKYQREMQYPADSGRGYPATRHTQQFYTRPPPGVASLYQNFNARDRDRKKTYIFRHVDPPTYYERWGGSS